MIEDSQNVKKEHRIGLFGGTFDPVHEGHVAIAKRAKQALSLDRLIFIPAADPPHKKQPGTSYSHRVAMLENALADLDEKYEISLLESERATPSYTVDTLVELKKRLGEKSIFYFIIGADSLLELHLWYRYPDLPTLTNFIVATRPGISIQAMNQAIQRLPGLFFPDQSHHRWTRSDGAQIILLTDVEKNISSSAIRHQLGLKKKPGGIDSRVLDYIVEHRLYRS